MDDNTMDMQNDMDRDEEAMELIRKAAEFTKNGHLKLLMDYCAEQGISPEELIQQHSQYTKATKEFIAEAIERERSK